MADTLVGLYRTLGDAQQVISELRDAGIRREDISLIAQDTDGEYSRYFSKASGSEVKSDTGSGTGKGTGIGAVLGGAAGLLFGLGILAVPGLGPVLAAGPIVSALAGAGVGAAAGGLVGALTDAGVPEHDATQYMQGVRRGGILVTVHAASKQSDRALQVMNRHNPINVNEQVTEQGNQKTNSQTGVAPDLDDHDMHGRIASDTVQGYMRSSDRSGNTNTLPDLHPGETLGDTSTGQRDWVPGTPDAHPRMTIAKTPDATVVDRPFTDIPASMGAGVVDDQARIRSEQVDLRRPPHNPKVTGTDDSSLFRGHYQQRYAHGGLGFDDYLPAYRYGFDLGGDQFRGREWSEIEDSVRRDWERVYPEIAWDDYSDAVYKGWSLARDKVR